MSTKTYVPTITPAGTASQQGVKEGMPTGTNAGVSSQYIYTLANQDLFNRSELRKLFERHKTYDPNFYEILTAMGWTSGCTTPEVGHYETDWTWDNFVVKSIVSGGASAGAAIVLELDDSRMHTFGGVSSSFPNVGDVLMFDTGIVARITSKNTAVTPHQFTLDGDDTVQLDTYVTPTETYPIITNSHGEGTKWPAGRIKQYFRYYNDFQIFKNAVYSTGTNLTDAPYLKLPGNGTNGGSYFVDLESQVWKDHRDNVSGALLAGARTTGITDTSEFMGNVTVPVKHTEGLITFASQYGHNETHTRGAMIEQDFFDRAAIYHRERVTGKDIYVACGYDYHRSVNKALLDYVKGDADGRYLRGMGTEMEVKSGFRAIDFGDIKLNFKTLYEFSNVKGLDMFSDNAVYYPMMINKDRSPSSNPSKGEFSMGYEYKVDKKGYSRNGIVVNQDGTGKEGTRVAIQDDGTGHMVLTEAAAHFTCSNLSIWDVGE